MTGSDDVSAIFDGVPEGDCDAARTLACRRSLRSSRARRAAARTRRRRILSSRGSAIAATAGLLLASGGALAATGTTPLSSGQAGGLSTDRIATVQRALGVAADGIVGPLTRGAVTSYQRAHGLIADGVIGPQTLASLGLGSAAAGARAAAVSDVSASAAAAGTAPDSTLARIAACESAGNPTAISGDGRYRGKYQFSWATWKFMGGSGDPAQAAEAEQDRLAAKLLRVAGTSPWPNCA